MKIVDIITESPVLRKLKKPNNWEYAAKWECHVRLSGDGWLHFTINPGYWTDLASVPKALRGAFDNGSGEYGVLIASQLHDMLYATHYMSKNFADELFHKVLRYYGMNRIKAWLYYQAVHLFGDDAWEAADDDMYIDRGLCKLMWFDR